MANVKEGKEVDALIRSYIDQIWPGGEISAKGLRDLSPQFLRTIFCKFFFELKKDCASMFDRDFDLPADIMEYCSADTDRDRFLYAHIKDLVEKMIGVPYLSFMDILIPENRKMRTSIKMALNFLVFMKTRIESGRVVVHEILSASKTLEDLSQAKIELTEIISMLSEDIGIKKETLAIINSEYEEELRIAAELHAMEEEIEAEEGKIDELEAAERQQKEHLAQLEKEEAILLQKIFTEDDYKELKEKEMELMTAKENLDKEITEIDSLLHAKGKNTQHLRSVNTLLWSIDFSSWDCLEKIEELEKEMEIEKKLNSAERTDHLVKTMTTMQEELEQLRGLFSSEQKSHEVFCREYKERRVQLQEDQQAEYQYQEELSKEYIKISKCYNAMKDKCTENEDEIKQIIEFNSNMYKKFLDQYSRVTTVFDGYLKDLFESLKRK